MIYSPKAISLNFLDNSCIHFSIILPASAPKATPRAAITDLSAKVVAPDKVELAWSAATGSVREYRLYRNGHLLAKTTSLSYTDTAAPKNVLTYRVRVVDEQGRLSPVSNAAKVDLRSKKWRSTF